MAIRKRGDSWQIDILLPTGAKDEDGKEIRERHRKTFSKLKDARAEHDKLGTLVREKRYLDVKKEYLTTLKELVDHYRDAFQGQSSYATNKKSYLKNFLEFFGEDTRLSDIGYLQTVNYKNKLTSKVNQFGRTAKDASVNHELTCLHHIFSMAVEWGLMDKSPFDGKRGWLIKSDNSRKRYLMEDEISRLLGECRPKKHLYHIVVTALNTGMRKTEILTLKWDQIRNGFIYLQKTKTKMKREIPINADLEAVFKEIRREQGLSSAYVFLYARRNIGGVYRAFNGAVERAGIEDFTFHDLRHTFASHLVMRGASLKEIQELLGHKTMTMTMRYAHLAEENKKKAVGLLNGLTSPMSQNVTKGTISIVN